MHAGLYQRSPTRRGTDHTFPVDDQWDTEADDQGGPRRATQRLPPNAPRLRPARASKPPPAGRRRVHTLLQPVALLLLLAAAVGLLFRVVTDRAATHVVMFTNRQESALVVLRSIIHHCAAPSRLTFHLVVTDPARSTSLSLYASRLARTGGPSVLLYTLGELTLELQADGVVPMWLAAPPPGRGGAGNGSAYVVRPAAWDDDPKHGNALNHARFYIADMRFARRLRSLLFVDDDIVVQSDARAAARLRPARGRALLVSCNAINFDPSCGWFHVGWDTMTYAHTAYFGFPAFGVYGRTQADAVCRTDAQTECIAKGGFELLQRAALRINGQRIDFDHKAWNFGYVVVDLAAWRRLRLRHRYEAWLDANAEQRFFAPTSLGFGLGIPYLVLHGAVQCFDPHKLRIVEGLAVMDQFDMGLSNVSVANVTAAHVLHYTGARKPWLPEAIAEFAAPYARFEGRTRAAPAAVPKRLFVVVGGEHAGMEWLMSTLDAHPAVCASGEGKDTLNKLHSFARHALMPPTRDMARTQLASDWVTPCSRAAMCTWRHVSWLATTQHGDVSGYALQGDVAAWRAWWAGAGRGNRTALFHRFLSAALGVEDGAAPRLRLPCACSASASAMGFKFLDLWTEETRADPWAAGFETIDGPAALAVFKSMGAAFVSWERGAPVDAYLSLQKSVASGQWHCPTPNCLPPNAPAVAVDVAACRSYVAWYRAAHRRMEGLLEAAGVAPERFVFEDCYADQPACFARLAALLGIAPELLPLSDTRAGVPQGGAIEHFDIVREQCGEIAVR